MKKQNFGHVVAIASILSNYGIDNEVPYCASKAAFSSLIESAREHCFFNNGDKIKFHTIYCNKIDTEMFNHIFISYLYFNILFS